ncbi:tyrosine-type recombinase/integrase [Streptomyces sp. NPDC005931]|uniref:tyrosine-type recombinase/integrase n=1 Tax=Streptomyces sp. NPDC005931 TaxID=3364737 RepID=UPI00367C2257
MKALTEHRERQAQEQAAAGTAWKEHGLVFTSRIGSPLEPDNLRRWSWYPLRQRIGINLRFHDRRQSAFSLLLDLGAPPHIVRQIVGHSDIGVMMKIYASVYGGSNVRP